MLSRWGRNWISKYYLDECRIRISVPWFRGSIAGLSRRGPASMTDLSMRDLWWTKWQWDSWILRFTPVRIILLMHPTRMRRITTFIRRSSGEAWKTSNKWTFFFGYGERLKKEYFLVVFLSGFKVLNTICYELVSKISRTITFGGLWE